MSSKSFSIGVVTAVAALLAGPAYATESVTRIGWDALLPAGAAVENSRTPASAAEYAKRGEELAWNLAGRQIELTGFLLPSDREGDEVFEFLLVPWAGACSHMPSPPPNQVVLVRPTPPYRAEAAYEIVTVSGALVPSLTKTQLFILDGVKVVESGYRVSRAQVSRAGATSTSSPVGKTPWGFLEN